MIPRRQRRLGGFTFLEIMFVVVIIGILLALVGPRLAGRTQEARITATRTQMHGIDQAIKNYEMDMGTFPRDLEELIEPRSGDEDMWRGPYIDSDVIPTDAWGEEFIYKYPGDHNRRGFDLYSKGPDRQENTDDDITNWTRRN